MKRILIGLICFALVVTAAITIKFPNNEEKITSEYESNVMEYEGKEVSDDLKEITIDSIDGTECNQFIYKLQEGEMATFTYSTVDDFFDTFCSQSIGIEEKTWDAYLTVVDNPEIAKDPIGVGGIEMMLGEGGEGITSASIVNIGDDVYLGFYITLMKEPETNDYTYTKIGVNLYSIDGMSYVPSWTAVVGESEGDKVLQDYTVLDTTYGEYKKDFDEIEMWYGVQEKPDEGVLLVDIIYNNSTNNQVYVPNEGELNLEILDYDTLRELIEATTKEIIEADLA